MITASVISLPAVDKVTFDVGNAWTQVPGMTLRDHLIILAGQAAKEIERRFPDFAECYARNTTEQDAEQ